MAVIFRKDDTIQIGDKILPARLDLDCSNISSAHDLDLFFKKNGIEMGITNNEKSWEREAFSSYYQEIKEKLDSLLQVLQDIQTQKMYDGQYFVQEQKNELLTSVCSIMQSIAELLNEQLRAIEKIKTCINEAPRPESPQKQVERLRRIMRESKHRCFLMNLPENERIKTIKEEFLGKEKLEVFEAVESSNFQIIAKEQLNALKTEYIRSKIPVLFQLVEHYQERLRAASLRSHALQKGILVLFERFGLKVNRDIAEQLNFINISNETYVPDEESLEMSIAA